MTIAKEGWGFPGRSGKAHFFTEDGRSLCLGWGFYSGPMEDGNNDSPDNCAACKKAFYRRHHDRHGDMDGKTCLLEACSLHYPKGRKTVGGLG